jgi:CRP/FNR family cyclic AMP-dependent transcriptional regulator
MNRLNDVVFDLPNFLTHSGLGRKVVSVKPKHIFFSQGSTANSVFYLQKGRVKLSVMSSAGKEATITFISAGDFIGEESMAKVAGLHMASAIAITPCTALKIQSVEMVRVMQQEQSFSDMFRNFLLDRSMRIQADLVDQLTNSSEKRLARILLQMAEFDWMTEEMTLVPPVTQGTLADMIGTTRSRVSFFMNRFRKMGFIEYNYSGRIRVHRLLLDVVLQTDYANKSTGDPIAAYC